MLYQDSDSQLGSSRGKSKPVLLHAESILDSNSFSTSNVFKKQ